MYEAVFKFSKSSTKLESKLLLLFCSWLVLKQSGFWFDIQMRCENLPDGVHHKVTWKCSRDCSRDQVSRQRNSETWWRRSIATLLGILFGSYSRRSRDVLMWRRGYVPLRHLGDVHWDFVGCFIWDLFERWWRRTDESSSLRLFETSSWHSKFTQCRRTTETFWRRSTETSLGVSFETYLWRRWDVQRDVITTSPRRLISGWICSFYMRKFPLNRLIIFFYHHLNLKHFC